MFSLHDIQSTLAHGTFNSRCRRDMFSEYKRHFILSKGKQYMKQVTHVTASRLSTGRTSTCKELVFSDIMSSVTYQARINVVSDDKLNRNHIPMEIQKPNFTVQWTELLCKFRVSTVQTSAKKLRCVMVISHPFRQYSTTTLLQMHPSISFH
jgi:hypothetical protein